MKARTNVRTFTLISVLFQRFYHKATTFLIIYNALYVLFIFS